MARKTLQTDFQVAFQKGKIGNNKISQVAKLRFLFETQEYNREIHGIYSVGTVMFSLIFLLDVLC